MAWLHDHGRKEENVDDNDGGGYSIFTTPVGGGGLPPCANLILHTPPTSAITALAATTPPPASASTLSPSRTLTAAPLYNTVVGTSPPIGKEKVVVNETLNRHLQAKNNQPYHVTTTTTIPAASSGKIMTPTTRTGGSKGEKVGNGRKPAGGQQKGGHNSGEDRVVVAKVAAAEGYRQKALRSSFDGSGIKATSGNCATRTTQRKDGRDGYTVGRDSYNIGNVSTSTSVHYHGIGVYRNSLTALSTTTGFIVGGRHGDRRSSTQLPRQRHRFMEDVLSLVSHRDSTTSVVSRASFSSSWSSALWSNPFQRRSTVSNSSSAAFHR